jgi:hypothetical protein
VGQDIIKQDEPTPPQLLPVSQALRQLQFVAFFHVRSVAYPEEDRLNKSGAFIRDYIRGLHSFVHNHRIALFAKSHEQMECKKIHDSGHGRDCARGYRLFHPAHRQLQNFPIELGLDRSA